MRRGLPRSIYDEQKWTANMDARHEQLVNETIMHAHCYDGTTEALPKRLHPMIFWRSSVYPFTEGVTAQRAQLSLCC